MSTEETQRLDERHAELLAAIQTAADLCANGNVTKLARQLGRSRQRLYAACKAGKFPPALAKKIEDLTGGRISRVLLNPSLFS